MIKFTVSGSFSKLESYLRANSKRNIDALLHKYAQEGVAALSKATRVRSGLAANSWGYEVSSKGGSYTITWTNSDIEGGFPVVIMLQYGYGTGTGGYVEGEDFINPAIQPIFQKIATEVWKAVTSK